MYAELSVNEGRSLYIPYGTYDSYHRSIEKERLNMVNVSTTTQNFDSRLDSLTSRALSCVVRGQL